jgi:hypothetical protein
MLVTPPQILIPPVMVLVFLALAAIRFRLFTNVEGAIRTRNRRIALVSAVCLAGIMYSFILAPGWFVEGRDANLAAGLLSLIWCTVVLGCAAFWWIRPSTTTSASSSVQESIGAIVGLATLGLVLSTVAAAVSLDMGNDLIASLCVLAAMASVYLSKNRRSTIEDSLRFLLVLSFFGTLRVGVKGLIGSAAIACLLAAVVRWWPPPDAHRNGAGNR